jgi:hypothetical protein
MRLLLAVGAAMVAFLALILLEVDVSDIRTSVSTKRFSRRIVKRQERTMQNSTSAADGGNAENETTLFTNTTTTTTEAIPSTEASKTKNESGTVSAGTQEETPKNITIMYTIARKDRSGAFIKDMICAHVYALRKNYTYAGACNHKPQKRPIRLYQLSALNLLKFIGLEYELPFYGPSVVCPSALVLDGISNTTILVRQEAYDGPDRACSRGLEAWRHQMANTLASSAAYKEQPKKGGAVLHIRRGDISPCSSMPWVSQRYLSNRYYQQLIDDYIPPNMTVTIYSETSSFEPWDSWTMPAENVTTNRTFEIRLDTPLNQVWQHIMTADIYILSRDSAFSYVPAILNMNASQVIFTPSTYFRPLPAWTVVPNETLEMARQDLERIQSQHCPTKR